MKYCALELWESRITLRGNEFNTIGVGTNKSVLLHLGLELLWSQYIGPCPSLGTLCTILGKHFAVRCVLLELSMCSTQRLG